MTAERVPARRLEKPSVSSTRRRRRGNCELAEKLGGGRDRVRVCRMRCDRDRLPPRRHGVSPCRSTGAGATSSINTRRRDRANASIGRCRGILDHWVARTARRHGRRAGRRWNSRGGSATAKRWRWRCSRSPSPGIPDRLGAGEAAAARELTEHGAMTDPRLRFSAARSSGRCCGRVADVLCDGGEHRGCAAYLARTGRVRRARRRSVRAIVAMFSLATRDGASPESLEKACSPRRSSSIGAPRRSACRRGAGSSAPGCDAGGLIASDRFDEVSASAWAFERFLTAEANVASSTRHAGASMRRAQPSTRLCERERSKAKSGRDRVA